MGVGVGIEVGGMGVGAGVGAHSVEDHTIFASNPHPDASPCECAQMRFKNNIIPAGP